MEKNTPLLIRSATPDDEEAVVALWYACGLVTPDRDPVDSFRRAQSGASSDVLVGEDESGAIVGSVMVGDDGHAGGLYYMAAAPSARGQGIGQRMLAEGEAWLRQRGVRRVRLIVRNTNRQILSFYERFGFEVQPWTAMRKIFDDESDRSLASPAALPTDPA